MTYHCGISGFGAPDREPQVTCDGCGATARCLKPNGYPYTWWLSHQKPPGWKLVRVEEPFSRKDYCRDCKAKVEPLTDRNLRSQVGRARANRKLGVK